MRKILLSIGFCCFIVAAACGQSEGYYFHHLTVMDGLSEGTNYFIYKDSKGFMWIGSLNGLNRYDGRRVKTYYTDLKDTTSLLGQYIQSPFFEDALSNLWFSTYEGINHYVRKTDNFRRFRLMDKDGAAVMGYYIFHREQNGNLWILVQNKAIYILNAATGKFDYRHDMPNAPHRVYPVFDEQGAIRQTWAYSLADPGILITDYLPGNRIQQNFYFSKKDPIPVSCRQVLHESDTLVWIASKRGLLALNPKTNSMKVYNSFLDEHLGICNSMSFFGENEILAAFVPNGLLVFDKKERRFKTNYKPDRTNPHSLSTYEIATIYASGDGGYWLGSEGAGTDFFYPAKHKFKSIKIAPEPLGSQLPFDVKTLMQDDDGNIWCGTATQGVVVLNRNGGLVAHHKLGAGPHALPPAISVNRIFKDALNRIWVLSFEGLFLWRPEQKGFYFVPESNGYPTGAALSNNTIVLAHNTKGLSEVKETGDRQFHLHRIPSIDTTDSFPCLWESSNKVLYGSRSLSSIWVMDYNDNYKVLNRVKIDGDSRAFCETKNTGNIWVANSFGLLRLYYHAYYLGYKLYGQKEGLATPDVYALLADDTGRLWLSTSKGLANYNPATRAFQNYTLADGLSSLNFNNAAALRLDNGEFWFGSNQGITAFYPGKVSNLEVAAKPVITALRINDQENPDLIFEKTGVRNVSEIESITLEYRYNTLSFNFAALEYSDPSNTNFQFFMEGIDKGWLNAGNNDFTRYAGLSHGRYTLHLRATNSDGEWSQERQIKIRIEPPYYFTWWFAVLVLLALGGVFGIIMRVRRARRARIKQMEEESRLALEMERQRIARDMHDDLGSGLSALSLLTEIARHKQEAELKSDIEKINSSARELSGKIREVIWTVNARNDTLANLISYLHYYTIDLFDNADIDCRISLPENLPASSITGEHRRTVFLAYKEALNNLLKHAKATLVTIEFLLDNHHLSIRITDNGKGFDPALLQNSTGNGLMNMQGRLKEIGGACEIMTGSHGTKVSFSLKLAA